MKVLITSFFILFGFQVCSQSNLVVGLTDYNIMFRAYDNKLQCQIDGVDSVYIKSPEGKSDVSFEIDQLTGQKYFIIRPNSSPSVDLEIHAIKNGRDVIYATRTYYVKAYPKPNLINSVLSKSSPTELDINYSDYFPINTKFEILGGEVETGDISLSFTGSVIPTDLLKKLKKGDHVALTIRYRKKGVSETNVLQTTMTIVD